MSKRIITVIVGGVVGIAVCSYLALCFALSKVYRIEQQYQDDHLY